MLWLRKPIPVHIDEPVQINGASALSLDWASTPNTGQSTQMLSLRQHISTEFPSSRGCVWILALHVPDLKDYGRCAHYLDKQAEGEQCSR